MPALLNFIFEISLEAQQFFFQIDVFLFKVVNFIASDIGYPLSLVNLLVHFIDNFLEFVMFFGGLSCYLFYLFFLYLKFANFMSLFGFSSLIGSDDVLFFCQNGIKLHALLFQLHFKSNLGFSFLVL